MGLAVAFLTGLAVLLAAAGVVALVVGA